MNNWVLPMARRSARLLVSLATQRRLPYSVTFILTHRCNFQCDYCDIPAAAGEELTTAEFRRAIDELADAGLARASFSGGEALLRPDAIELIAHAKSRGLFTSLNSNGWLIPKLLPQLAPILDMLVVSLDGPEASHDLVRRRQGSYARVVETLDAARARGIAVATITVLSRTNWHVVDEVLALAKTHGFWAYFQPAYEDCFDHAAGLDPSLSGALLADLATRLSAACDAGEPVAASPTFLARLGQGPQFGDCASCHAGRYFGTVMPDGTVVPCHLVSRAAAYPNGKQLGFARAFFEMPHPTDGPGCAISPYQESDLIFHLDRGAIGAALKRLLGPPRAA